METTVAPPTYATALPANIRLELRWLVVTNALAYLTAIFITTEKVLYVLSDVRVILIM